MFRASGDEGADAEEDAGRPEAPGAVLATVGVVVEELPPRYGFVIAAGLETVLSLLEAQAFPGDVWAVPEGTPVFGGDPIVELSGPADALGSVAAAVAEAMAPEVAAASVAARVCVAAGGRPVVDASERLPDPEGSRRRARAAAIGGATHTTNAWAAERFDLLVIEPLDPGAAFPNVTAPVVARDDLDEVEIQRLVARGAPVTAFAFGARFPDLALAVEELRRHAPPPSVATDGAPCPVQLFRYPACNGDVVVARDEPPVLFARPLLAPVMCGGRRVEPQPSVEAARTRCAEALAALPRELLDLEKPEPVTVSWSRTVRRTVLPPGEDQ
jgi:hypothetical protein